MTAPPIPQRIPPLVWRRPAALWTPLALAAAIGWPALLFFDDRGPLQLSIAALLIVFALAGASLLVSQFFGAQPRARRIVVLHVVLAGLISALAAPLVVSLLFDANAESASFALSSAATPLLLMVGLPIVLVSGLLFAWIAFQRVASARPHPQ